MVCSAVIGVSCALVGMTVSIIYGTPSGATIVAADIAALAICKLIGLRK